MKNDPSSPSVVPVDQRLAWLAAIVASSDDAIVSKTLDGIITSWNHGAERIFGYTADEMVGQSITRLLPPDRLGEEERILDRLRRGEKIDHFESLRLAKDGRTIHVSLTISPIRDQSGQVVGASKIARDITERRRADQAVREAKEAAEVAIRTKDRFLAALSHELRTPLTPILATVTAIQGRTDLPEDLYEQLVGIRRNVEIEARLIDDLLDLARFACGEVMLHREAVEAHSALRDALRLYEVEIHSKRLDVTLALNATRSFVWADPSRLRQIFWNLISNAVKFTPDRGHIQLRTRDGDDGLLFIEVSDSGIGIEPEKLHEVFDSFGQGDPSPRRGRAGLGLGLTLSKALTELHGGRLAVQSAGLGQGATVTLRLDPIANPPDWPPLDDDSQDDRRLRILLVEDHEDTRLIISRLLRRLGHEVYCARGVREAREAAGIETFDLLISDIGLPDGSGLEVMEFLKERSGLRGISLSGFGMDEDRRRSREAGFERHLTKPVDFRDLEAAIRLGVR